MTTDPKYPKRSYGLERVNMSYDPTPAFKRTMKLYQAYYKEKYGYPVSQTDMIVTSLRQHNDKFRQFLQVEEGKDLHERKHLDGIKTIKR